MDNKPIIILLVAILAVSGYTAYQVKVLVGDLSVSWDWMADYNEANKDKDGFKPLETAGDVIDFIGCKIHEYEDLLAAIEACCENKCDCEVEAPTPSIE